MATQQGTGSNVHTYTQQEKNAYVKFINNALEANVQMKEAGYVPIDPDTQQIFTSMKDGQLLAHLLDWCVPNSIDFKRLIAPKNGKPLNTFQLSENVKYVITSIKNAGVPLINIGAQDIIEGKDHLILAILFQLFKKGLERLIQLEMERNREMLAEMGIKFDSSSTPDKILVDFYNSCLKKAKSKTVCRTMKDISNVHVIASAFYVHMPQVFTNQDCQLTLHDLAKKIIQVSNDVGIPQNATEQDLETGDQKLCFIFAAQVAIEMMRRPKISEKFLVQFLNETAKSSTPAVDIMGTVGNDVLYGAMEAVLGKASAGYSKAGTMEQKVVELLRYIEQTDMPHILDHDKLTDSAQKDFLVGFVTELYQRTLIPVSKVEDWVKRHLGKELHLGDQEIVDGSAVVQILGILNNNKQLLKAYLDLTDIDEKRAFISTELQKLSISFAYGQTQLVDSTKQMQHILLSEMYRQYPYILDESFLVTSDMLTNCTNELLQAHKAAPIRSVNNDLQDMDKLAAVLGALTGVEFRLQPTMSSVEKAACILSTVEKELNVEKCMKPESLAMGGEKYVNILVSTLINNKLPEESMVIDYVNAKYGTEFVAAQMAPEDKIYSVCGYLVDTTIFREAAEYQQASTSQFSAIETRMEILQHYMDLLGMNQSFPSGKCSQVVARTVLNGLACALVANDDYVLQELQTILQKKIAGFSEKKGIEEVVNKMVGVSGKSGEEMVKECFKKLYAREPSPALTKHISQNYGGTLAKIVLHELLQAVRVGIENIVPAMELLNERLVSQFQEKEVKTQEEQEFWTFYDAIPDEYALYKNMFGLMFLDKPDACLFAQQDIDSICKAQVDKDLQQKMSYQDNQLGNLLKYYQIFDNFLSKCGRKEPYEIHIVARSPSLVQNDYMYAVYRACEKPDDFYTSWVNKHLAKCQYTSKLPTGISEINDGYMYSLILCQAYPNQIVANNFEGMAADEYLVKSLELCVNHKLSIPVNVEYFKSKNKFVIKLFLKLVFTPIDPIQERIFIPSYEMSMKILTSMIEARGIKVDELNDLQKVLLLYGEKVAPAKQDTKQLLQMYQKPLQISSYLAGEINKLLQTNYVKPDVLAEGDKNMMSAVVNDLLTMTMLPKQLLLKGVDDFVQVKSLDAFKHVLGISGPADFGKIQAAAKELGVELPFKSEDQLLVSDEKYAQIFLSQIYERKLRTLSEIEDFMTLKLYQSRYRAEGFNADKRGERVAIAAGGALNPDIFRELISCCLSDIRRQVNDVQGEPKEQIRSILNILSQNGVVCNFIEPEAILGNDTRAYQIIFSQLYEKVDLLKGKKWLSIQAIEQALKLFMQHQFTQTSLLQDKSYELLLRDYKVDQKSSSFNIKALARPDVFVLVYGLLHNQMFKLDGANDEEKFEGILQQIQYAGVQTQYCKSQHMVGCQSDEYQCLMTDILQPRKEKMQYLVNEYNKYFRRDGNDVQYQEVSDIKAGDEELIVRMMYPNQFKGGDVAKFLQSTGCPAELFAEKRYYNTMRMVTHVPYDIVDDYIIYDECNIMKWLNKLHILPQKTKVTELTVQELAKLAEYIDPFLGITKSSSDYENLKAYFENVKIQQFYSEQQLNAKNEKIINAMLNQIKLTNMLQFKSIRKACNNMFQLNNIQYRVDDQSDLKQSDVYLYLIKLVNPDMTGKVDSILEETKDRQQQLNQLFELLQQLDMCLPKDKRHLQNKKQVQLELFKELLAETMRESEMVAYINRLNQRAGQENVQIEQIIQLCTPANIVCFLHARFPDVYPKSNAQPSEQELFAILDRDETINLKLSPLELRVPSLQTTKLFVIEHFTPIDEASDKRKLPVGYLIDFMRLYGVATDNIGRDMEDGTKLTQLLKALDKDNFDACTSYEAVLQRLAEIIPDSAFLTAKDAGNQRYNNAVLTMIYETYMVGPPMAVGDLSKWVNSCLRFQSNTSKRMASHADLYDGEILAALLEVLEGDAAVYRLFQQATDQNRQYAYLCERISSHGVVKYLQETDFRDGNDYALSVVLTKLYCDTDYILGLVQNPKELLLSWVEHKCITKSQDNVQVASFSDLDQAMLLQVVKLLYEYIQADTLDAYLDNLHQVGYCPYLTLQHLQAKYNHAGVYYLIDSIRQLEAIPKKHLINFINIKILDGKNSISNLADDISDGEAVIRLMNYVAPDACDLKPLQIQNKMDRAKVIVDYAQTIDLGHIISPQVILEGQEQQLHLFIEELYRKQIKEQAVYVEWVNAQIARARRPDLFLQSLQFGAIQLNCLFQRLFPQVYGEIESGAGILDNQDNDVQKKVLLQFLLVNYGCDFISDYDIDTSSYRINYLLDLVYKPLLDFSTLETLPVKFIQYYMRKNNSETETVTDENALEPYNVMNSIYNMYISQHPDIADVYVKEEYEDQTEELVKKLSTFPRLREKISIMDGYDFGYNADACRYAASEVIKADPRVKTETALCQFVNQMLWKIYGGEKQISNIVELGDGVAIGEILVGANIAAPHEFELAEDDLDGHIGAINTVLQRCGYQYTLDAKDITYAEPIIDVLSFIDGMLTETKHIDEQRLVDWCNQVVVNDPISDVQQMFSSNGNIAALSDLLCRLDIAQGKALQPLEPDGEHVLEDFMHQCQVLGLGRRIKVQDVKELNMDAVCALLTEIYGQNLPPESEVVGLMTELLKKQGISQDINNYQDLQDSTDKLNQAISVLDPQGKRAINKDPFLGLQKNIKNLGLTNYCQPEDLTQLEKLKVLIRSALQSRDADACSQVIVNPIEQLLLTREKIVLAKLPAQNIKPVSVQTLRDSCLLAKIMDRIEPSCFESCMIYEYPQQRDEMRAWELNKLLNYNACVRVLQGPFQIDLRGCSGKDLCSGDPKFLSSVMWRLGKYEIARVEQRIGSVDDYLAAMGIQNVDWNTVNSEFCAAIMNIVVPELVAFKDEQNEQQRLQQVLDLMRGMGLWILYRPQDVQTGNADVTKSIVGQLLELLAEKQSAAQQ